MSDHTELQIWTPHIPILDYGYLKHIEHWGSDERIIESARMSTGGGFVSWEPYDKHPRGDQGLLEFLWRKKHTTPFECCGLTIEVKAPIMVFREWQRHRTQSYNEASARYMPLPDENYLPTLQRCLRKAGKNKQAQGLTDKILTETETNDWLKSLNVVYEHCEQVYQDGLRLGIPKELARLCLHVGRYSTMRASANLLNWFRFLSRRLDASAQEEIRLYAGAVAGFLNQLFPRATALFQNDFDQRKHEEEL